ncbi:hypothetical protein C8A05DRAFT_31650 [Staphylotrichum tortipilum]|uniref:Uncharacterized protein n=1 Tax=Staphylotrichum tortipilum TaxID=2831512 RepID=A0AAN6MQH2_9PEZI|nr:hypothetical protein C8A05DRAFT_31650 [Staphylotrichum longicolle]
MADADSDRPASRGYHYPAPPSPRPSVTSRASGSSLRREQERQEAQAHPASVAYSRPFTPQTVAGPAEEPLHAVASPPPAQHTQPPFSPLFTLVASTSHPSNRQTIQYPTVHYIFADDDPEILTAALAHHHGSAFEDNDEENERDNPPDRAVLLDMEPTADGSGVDVAWASSLTPDWAVTSARVSPMEGGGGGGVTVGPGGGHVLKIEGVSIEPSSGRLGKTAASETELQSSGGSTGRQPQQPPPATEGYADLLQEFERRMSTLRMVAEAAMARQRALGDGAGQFSEGVANGNLPAAPRPGTSGEDAPGGGGEQPPA